MLSADYEMLRAIFETGRWSMITTDVLGLFPPYLYHVPRAFQSHRYQTYFGLEPDCHLILDNSMNARYLLVFMRVFLLNCNDKGEKIRRRQSP